MKRLIDGLTFERFGRGGKDWLRIDLEGASLVLGWETLVQFMAEERASGPGHLIVALDVTERYVHLQLPASAESVGWIRFTPDEARQLARLLVKKADEALF